MSSEITAITMMNGFAVLGLRHARSDNATMGRNHEAASNTPLSPPGSSTVSPIMKTEPSTPNTNIIPSAILRVGT